MTKNIPGKQIEKLAKDVVGLILAENYKEIIKALKPLLDTKTPFLKLDLLGRKVGELGVNKPRQFFKAFDVVIEYDAMGSYVVVGSALMPFLETEFDLVMEKTREYIIKGDVWHACDNMAERSLGHALVDYFDKTLPWLKKFLKDENHWVKRSVGVAIHFFSKRVLNGPLLFLSPV